MTTYDVEKSITKRKRKILKLAKTFLIVIIILTFFSQSINNLSLPKVEVQNVSLDVSLTKNIREEGIVVAKDRRKYYTDFNAPIKEMRAKAGDIVKKGDILMVLDDEEIEEELGRKRLELEQTSLELNRLVLEKDEINIYSYEQKLKEFYNDLKYKEKVYLNHKIMYEEGFESKISLEERLNDYGAAKIKYESAKKELDLQRENQKKQIMKGEMDIKEKEIEVKLKELEVEKLEKSQKNSVITAVCDGVLKEINFEKGMNVNNSKPLYVIDNIIKGFELEAELDNKTSRYIAIGDIAKVIIEDEVNLNSEGQVVSIYDNKENKNTKNLIIDLGKMDLVGGETGEIYLNKRIGQYDYVVPRSAIYKDNEGEYVFVLEEKEGTLGREYYTTKQKIEIGDSDNRFTGIISGLNGRERIVVFSNKPIDDGSQVIVEK